MAGDTDVMFAQMTLAHIAQGEAVTTLIAEKATTADLKALGAELSRQWTAEKTTLTGWLGEWDRPPAPDPDESAHAGHGDLHSLRPSDIEELRQASGTEFDRTAVSLLLGHLHNGIETARLEAGSGSYAPAISLAAQMTTHHQNQVQRLLTLAAGPAG